MKKIEWVLSIFLLLLFVRGDLLAETPSEEKIAGATLNEQEIANVHQFIDQIAHLDLLTLWRKEKEIKKFSKSIDEKVAPLPFLAIVLSNEKSKKNMLRIKKDSKPFWIPKQIPTKWESFLSGFSKRMNQEYEKGSLLKDIPTFAKIIHKEEKTEVMTRFIKDKEWEKLVLLLLEPEKRVL